MITVTLLGRITSMNEITATQNCTKVLNFSVANERYNGKENVSDFFNVVAWSGTAEFISSHFKVGKLIMITGTLINDNYEKDGVKYYSQKIVAFQVDFAGYNKSDFC